MDEQEEQLTVGGERGKGAGGGGAGTGGEKRVAADAQVLEGEGRGAYRHTPGNPGAERIGEYGEPEGPDDGPAGNRYGVG